MQTIIQSEIQRMGSNIFKEGGKVNGGNITLNKREFIKLAAGQLPATPSDVEDETFTDGDGIQIRILTAVAATGSDPDTIYVEYINTSSGTAGTSAIRCANGGTLTHDSATLSDMTIASSAATGQGLEASITTGSFYVQGHFVFAKAQSVFVSKYDITSSKELGFKLVQDIVTETDDDDLYDNQGAAPNVAAPGAHRYRITLTLTTRDQLAASDNFVYLGKVINDKLGKTVTLDNSYNVLRDTMAQRTKEESGDYIVNDFTAKFDVLNDSNLSLEVSDGLAYVDGYRIQIDADKITVPRAQTTEALGGDTIIPEFGNYIIFDSNYNLPELHTNLTLRNDSSFGGSKIGEVRIRSYEEDGANHRAYLYDIKMNSGQNFANTSSIGSSTSDYINILLTEGRAVLNATADNTLLFPLRYTRPSTIAYTSSNDITLQKKYTVTTNAGGTLASNQVISGGDTFTSSTSWVATDTSGNIASLTFDITLGSPAGTEFNITAGGGNTVTYDIYALQIHKGPTNFSAKTKSLAAQQTLTLNMQTDLDSDGNGTEFLSLRKADIYKVESINHNTAAGADLRNFFTVDNGQRDNYYGIGRLVKNTDVGNLPNGNAVIKFRYFTHSTSGTHFDVTSYPSGDSVGYTGIPNYRLNTGENINLRDYLDFRPVAGILADSSGVMRYTFDSAGNGSAIVPLLPVNQNAFDVNTTYYLPRSDRLVVSTKDEDLNRYPQPGELRYLQGVPDLTNPKYPEIPEGSLEIYRFDLDPYTLHESDLLQFYVEAKRFTMADIGRLEERIIDLEELTALSLLENATEALTVLDSAGNERTKAGFIADAFNTYDFSDPNRPEYRAYVDEVVGVLKPLQASNNIRLLYDSASSSTTRGIFRPEGDILTLPVDSNYLFIDQPLATETENVNPFAVITGQGHITLSPKSDNWYERRKAPDLIVDGGTVVKINRVQITGGGGGGGWNDDRGGRDGAGSSGGGTCFAYGTLFRMIDNTYKEIQDIVVGDIMFEGGKVYATIIGDGEDQDWFDYNGIHVTGSHPVLDNGVWKRVKDTSANEIQPYDKTYTLLNLNHIMVSKGNIYFTDYDEVEWVNDIENDTYVIDKLNQQDLYKKVG